MSSKFNEIDPIVKTTDENGEEHTFKLIEIVEIDDKEYGFFEYIEDENIETLNNNDEEPELIVMRIAERNKEFYFEVIEDEEEFNYVLDYVEQLDNDFDDEEEE